MRISETGRSPTPRVIDLSPSARLLVERAVRQGRGREVCAFVLIDDQGRQAIFRVDNFDGSIGCFHVPPCEIDRMAEYAEARGLTAVAFLHSHQCGVELSASDERAWRAGNIPWIVVRATAAGLESRWYGDPGLH